MSSTTGGIKQYQEDTAHASGDWGQQVLSVRNDTLATLAGTDGDYAPLQVNASGALYMDIANGGQLDTVLDNQQTTLDNILTNTDIWSLAFKTEDSAHVSGHYGLMNLTVRNDTLAALAGTDGDYAPLQVNASGALYVDGSGSTQPVSGTVTANLSATDNAVLDDIAANQTDKSQFTKITDGTEDASIQAPDYTWSGLGAATAVDVNSHYHHWWPTAGSRTGVAGDNLFYAGMMNDLGDAIVSVGSVTNGTGSTQISSGSGTVDNGSLRVAIGSDQLASTGQDTSANSYSVVLASDHGDVSIDDGGNSITVDGTVTATVSGGTFSSSAVDANNSTTTPLGGSATFTGTGTDCEGYASIAITIYADVDSAASGMQFQFSTDNTNWDDVYSFTMDVSDSDTRRFQFPISAQYFRVVYTNGGSAQSAFRVQTILHRTNILTSIHRIGDDTTLDRSAQLMKSMILGETTAGGGGTVNVKVNPSGSLTVEEGNSDDMLTALQTLDNIVAGNEAQVDIVTQPALDNTTDTITATHDTAALSNDGTLLTPKFAVIDEASSGDNTLVAAVVGKKIRVLAYTFVASGDVTVRFEDGAAGTALSGQMDILANSGISAGYNPLGYFETTANTLLNMELSAAVQVSGHLTYVEV